MIKGILSSIKNTDESLKLPKFINNIKFVGEFMNKRFSELTVSATDFANDDVIALDGETNGTRKMSGSALKSAMKSNTLATADGNAYVVSDGDVVRIKDWATSITAFRTGDVIPVDGPSGTAKMSKDSLIAIINEENANSPFITDIASKKLKTDLYKKRQVVLFDNNVSVGSNKYATLMSTIAGNYILEISCNEDVFVKVLQNATNESMSDVKDTIAEKFNIGTTPIRVFYSATTTTNKLRVDGAENKTLHIKLIKLIASDALPLTNELVSTGHSLSSSTAVGNNINNKIGSNAAFDMYRVKIPLGKIHLFDAISPIPVTGVTFAVCSSSGIVTKVFKGINGSYDIDATGDDYWIYYQTIAGFETQRPYADTDSLSFVNDAKATKGKVSDISDSLVSSENNVALELSGTTTAGAYCDLGYTFKKGYTYLVELSTDEDFITPKIQLGTSQTEGSMVDTIGENVSLSSSPVRLLYRCSGNSTQLRIKDYKRKNFSIKVYELLALGHNYIYSTIDQDIHAYVNGIKFRSELDNHITDFKKAGDLMVHVSSFCIISNVVYMTYYVNTQHATETPAEHRARFVICPLNDVDNKQYFDLQGAKDSGMSGSDIVFDGHSVDALYDTILMKIDNDTLFLMWTANLDGVGYCRLYQTYTISTATFSAIQYNQFKVGDNVGTFSATNMNAFFANAGINTKALSGDIGLMQKITSREESGVTYWYTGCYVGEFNCIVKSSDLITWEFVAQPDFFNHSQWENSVFVYGSRVFYFVRQLRSEPCAFLSVYNLDKKIWSKPIYVNDAQSRYDFFGFGGALYLVHSPYDRNHLSIIKIDTSDECRHIELQTAIVPDYFYPYVQSYAGELYMSFTQSRQHIWLSKFTIDSISDSTISSVFKTLFGIT